MEITKEELKDLYIDKKMSLDDISLIKKVSKESLKRGILRFKLTRKNKISKEVYANEEWLRHKFLELGMDAIEIANAYNFKKRTIQKWLEVYRLNRNYRRDNFKPTKKQFQIILGASLGDGCLSERKDINYIQFIHSQNELHKEYEYWIYKELKNMCKKEPSYIKPKKSFFPNGQGGTKEYLCRGAYRTSTRGFSFLRNIKSMSFKERMENFDDLSLSIWVLDDASFSSDNIWSLCMGSLAYKDVVFFTKWFKEKYLDDHIRISPFISNSGTTIYYVSFGVKCSKVITNMILKNIPNNIDIINKKIFKKVA